MAIVLGSRDPMQVVGDKRMAISTVAFITSGIGDLQTGLSRVEWADLQHISDVTVSNADMEVKMFRNSNAASENNSAPGTVHFDGAATNGIYIVRAFGY